MSASDHWLTTEAAGKRLGVASGVTANWVRLGRLRGRKDGEGWVVDPSSVEEELARVSRASWWRRVDMPERQAQQLQAAATKRLLQPGQHEINSSAPRMHRNGWKHVPLWVTRGPKTEVTMYPEAKAPMVVVRLGDTLWSRSFDAALLLLDAVMAQLDLNHELSRGPWLLFEPVSARLRRMGDAPIGEVTRVLRNVHPGVRELFEPQLHTYRSTVSLPTLGAPVLTEGWFENAQDGHLLFGGHDDLFGQCLGPGFLADRPLAE